jgi:hypothetical protein
MLSPRAIYGEIFRNDEAFRLFCSIAASGEAQGGWENGRIAALVPESCRDLAPKIARHGADEDKHLAYCHEELLRLVAAGHRREIESILRATARAEIAVYRDVSKAVMAHLGRTLRWSRVKSAILARGIDAVYLYDRLGGWHRMVALRMPARRDPLGAPASARVR